MEEKLEVVDYVSDRPMLRHQSTGIRFGQIVRIAANDDYPYEVRWNRRSCCIYRRSELEKIDPSQWLAASLMVENK